MTEEQHNIQPETENNTQQFFPKKKYQPAISYGGQFAILIGLFGFGIVVTALVTVVLWLSLTHTGISAMEENLANPAYSKALEIIQVASSVCMFFIPAAGLAIIVSRKPFKYLGFTTRISAKQIFWVILIILTALFLISNPLGIINEIIPIPKSWQIYFHQKEDEYSNAVEAVMPLKTFADYLLSLLIIAIAPAIVEESFFRGALQQLLVKWFKNVSVGIIIASVLFSAVHMSYYGFLVRAALGIFLGLIFYYGKNIWLNILAHFLNNGIALTQLYILTKSGKNIKEVMNDNSLPFISSEQSATTTVFAIIMLVIGVFIMRILFREFKKECVRLGVNEIDNTVQPSNNPFDE